MQTFKKLSLIFGLVFALSPCLASATELGDKTNCGTAKLTDAANCKNVVVEFSLGSCGSEFNSAIKAKIICDTVNPKAIYDSGDNRYEVNLQKSTDGWGASQWELAGPVKKVARKVSYKSVEKNKVANVTIPSQSQKVTASQSTASRAPASIPFQTPKEALPPSPPAVPETNKEAPKTTESPWKFSGFADFRYTSFSKDSSSGSTGYPESGFGLEDGAVYVNYQKDKMTLLLDVPFRRFKNSDSSATSTAPNASSNGNFIWGADKGQAYLKYSLDANADVTVGQFDTPFGVESNDSKDRFFLKTGAIYDYMTPVTHTGVMFSYTVNGAYVRIFDADPNNKGSLGNSSTGDNNYEYGGVAGYSNDNVRCQVGYITRPIANPNGLGGGMRSLSEVTAGATFGKMTLDFQGDLLSDASKNTLTPSNLNDREQDGIGELMLFTYSFNETYAAGFRMEHVEGDPGQVSIVRENTYAISGHRKINSQLDLRMDYGLYNYQMVNITPNLTDNRFSLAILFNF